MAARNELAHQMDAEATRMEHRAEHYREVANSLVAKAAALRRKAVVFRNEGGGSTPAEGHPWRYKAVRKQVRRPSAAGVSEKSSACCDGTKGPREGGGRLKGG